MRTRNDWQTVEVFVKAVIKGLLTGMALLALTASAETGWYKLILVSVTDHFDPQIGSYPTLRECATEGARRLHDQDLYAGFGCVFWDGNKHDPEKVSEHAALAPLTTTAHAQENPSKKNVVQPQEPYVLTLFPQFLEGVDAFDTRDACIERGVEFMATADIFTGFACEHGRAWQKEE